MPSGTSPENLLKPGGIYRVQVSSFQADGSQGTAIPHVTAVVRLDSGTVLPLHFFFVDLSDHPCASATENTTLNAKTAMASAYFQHTYLDELRSYLRAHEAELSEEVRGRRRECLSWHWTRGTCFQSRCIRQGVNDPGHCRVGRNRAYS